MYVGVKSFNLAPKLSISVDFLRKQETSDADDILEPRHSGSVEFSFGRVYKDAEDASTKPNQITNLVVKYGADHETAILDFDTNGAITNDLKCITDWLAPNFHSRLSKFLPRQDEVKFCQKLAALTTGNPYHVTLMILPDGKNIELHNSGTSNAVDEFFAMLPHKGNEMPVLFSDTPADPSNWDAANTPAETQDTRPAAEDTAPVTEDTPPAAEGTTQSRVKHAMTVPPYSQYRDASGKPRVQYGQMPAPYTMFDKHHPCPSMPMLPVYRDADEAYIVLGNSVQTRFVEEISVLEALEANFHKVKLVTIDDMVLIGITWSKRLMAGSSSNERITYPSGTIIKLAIHNLKDLTATSDEVRLHQTIGQVIGNTFGVPCDVLVVVLDKRAGDFAGLTTALASVKHAVFYDAALSSQIDDHSCKTLINAVKTTYDRDSAVTKQWPALLNDGGKLPVTIYAGITDCSKKKFDEAYDLLIKAGGKVWTRKQRLYIELFLNAPGGMALCAGPPGAGKTGLVLQLIAFCLRTEVNVYVTGMKQSILDLITTKFVEMFPKLPRPLRIYTQSSEDFYVQDTACSARDESELLILEMVAAEVREHKDKRSPLKMSHSIQHRVLEYSKRIDMPKMIRKIPTSSVNGVAVYDDETEYDYRELFHISLTALPEHPLSDKEFWTDERLGKFKYVYAALRAEVIQRSPFLIGTSLALNNKEISQHWSQDQKSVMINDEAHDCPEPASLVGAALPNWSKNVKVWAMLGDLKQDAITSLTSQGRKSTNNPFHEQSLVSLFSRLEMAGHPIVRLGMQCRLPSVLFGPLNELHYDMQVITIPARRKNLTENLTLIGEIVGRDADEIAAQTDAQRRMLLVEVGSPTMRAVDSPSRANPGFAAYVVDVVLPILRRHFQRQLNKKVMLVVPYAKQKELYLRLFFKLRNQGWIRDELPALHTIGASRGQEADFVIFDVVNDTREGFLSDSRRMCVAASRATKQMLWISGSLAKVKSDEQTRCYRDVTAGGATRRLTIDRPLLHWKKYFVDKKCFHQTAPPEFEVPVDLTVEDDKF